MPGNGLSMGGRLAWMAIGAVAVLLLAAGAGALVLFLGVYDVGALRGHTKLVYRVLETGMRESVRHHSAGVVTPPNLADARVLNQGALCFHEHCAQCHGAPGIAANDLAKGLLPTPNSLAQTGRDWDLRELYWVTRNGIGMAGMPAWRFRLADRDLWAVAAFVDRQLPQLTVREYQVLMNSFEGRRCASTPEGGGGDPEVGRAAMRQYACHGCHVIPGITGPEIYVGPPLEHFASRPFIAGVLPNTRDNLLRWLRDPHAARPQSLMPDLGVTQAHAEDMAAYLETLR